MACEKWEEGEEGEQSMAKKFHWVMHGLMHLYETLKKLEQSQKLSEIGLSKLIDRQNLSFPAGTFTPLVLGFELDKKLEEERIAAEKRAKAAEWDLGDFGGL